MRCYRSFTIYHLPPGLTVKVIWKSKIAFGAECTGQGKFEIIVRIRVSVRLESAKPQNQIVKNRP